MYRMYGSRVTHMYRMYGSRVTHMYRMYGSRVTHMYRMYGSRVTQEQLPRSSYRGAAKRCDEKIRAILTSLL